MKLWSARVDARLSPRTSKACWIARLWRWRHPCTTPCPAPRRSTDFASTTSCKRAWTKSGAKRALRKSTSRQVSWSLYQLAIVLELSGELVKRVLSRNGSLLVTLTGFYGRCSIFRPVTRFLSTWDVARPTRNRTTSSLRSSIESSASDTTGHLTMEMMIFSWWCCTHSFNCGWSGPVDCIVVLLG